MNVFSREQFLSCSEQKKVEELFLIKVGLLSLPLKLVEHVQLLPSRPPKSSKIIFNSQILLSGLDDYGATLAEPLASPAHGGIDMSVSCG